MINILIIQYVDENAKEGCEIGYANMKTKDFIGQHLTKYTVQMDFDRTDKNLYLTMRVSAIEIVEREMLFTDLYMEQIAS